MRLAGSTSGCIRALNLKASSSSADPFRPCPSVTYYWLQPHKNTTISALPASDSANHTSTGTVFYWYLHKADDFGALLTDFSPEVRHVCATKVGLMPLFIFLVRSFWSLLLFLPGVSSLWCQTSNMQCQSAKARVTISKAESTLEIFTTLLASSYIEISRE